MIAIGMGTILRNDLRKCFRKIRELFGRKLMESGKRLSEYLPSLRWTDSLQKTTQQAGRVAFNKTTMKKRAKTAKFHKFYLISELWVLKRWQAIVGSRIECETDDDDVKIHEMNPLIDLISCSLPFL